MEGNDMNGQEQFLTEIFPEELKEIKKRREKLFGVQNDHIENAIEVYEEFSKVRGEYEDAIKKKRSLRHRITEAKEKIANVKLLKMLVKLIPSKTNQPPEKSLEELEAEKKKVGGSFKKDGSPSINLGLVGLALSGGGIRSATFNLGVLQVLAKRGILKHVDYLSTVSGGGYIGSCVSSVLNNPETGPEKDKFPFRHEKGKPEPEVFKQLRRNSNFIAPGGFLDILRIPALLLRGTLINILVLLFYVIVAVGLTHSIRYCYYHYFHYSNIKPLQIFIIAIAASFFFILTFTFPFFSRLLQNKLKWNRRGFYENLFSISILSVFVSIIVTLVPNALSYSRQMDSKGFKEVIAGIISFIPVMFAGKAAEKISKWSSKLILYAVGIIGPIMLFIIYLYLCNMVLPFSLIGTPLIIYILGCLLFIYTRVFVDVNTTSLHNFYRDRLSKAYLFKTDVCGNVIAQNDEQRLFDLNTKGSKAPYHLINVSLNLPSTKDANLRIRNADFFILSKHFFGSLCTGYYNTVELETKIDPHINLGTAMAISGAAASPNMGTVTIKPLVFIMTLLNIRLGYWLPNPYQLRKHGYSKMRYSKFSIFTGVGPLYLLMELFGLIDEKSKYVNVSDGGHIENLGIYELLRRRCKYIIACDAEEDTDMTFGSLAKLMRYARIDLSIEIDIDLNDLRRDEKGLSHKHCAVGKIRYGGGETGYLLYIKSSLTGDEKEDILEYRSKNADFPHQSTGDQFFDEAQFEAYRALGYHIADKMDGWENGEKGKVDDIVDEWFQKLDDSLLPEYQMESKFVDMQKQLSDIERMYQDPDMAEYTYQIYPELLSNKKDTGKGEDKAKQEDMVVFGDVWIDKERFRKIFHFCNQQMQLMENVFVALQFDKPHYRDHHLNRGWMNLFRRWAIAPFFQWAWAVSISTYSYGYQRFCEESLNLCKKVVWRCCSKNNLSPDEKSCVDKQKQMYPSRYNNTDQIWIAEMTVCCEDAPQMRSFPIGFVIVRLSSDQQTNNCIVELIFYQIREYYRQMHLLEEMLQKLPDALKKECGGIPKLCVNFEHPDDKTRYGYFFERYGFEIR
ncbi:MAG TPA: patatin-like phospholipase family protein [Candidatus Wunengus sp. YC60]|uniref:patatin-like phospholipase family protein n=1 Tax=Candidatus Wunengus sp. YC60 TaxID=3367697 RepID=UPI0040277562